MFLVAVNYQNNLAFALVFLLLSLMMVSILHTYANLAGLTVEGVRGQPTFAGERAAFDLRLTRDGRRERHSLTLGWPGQAPMAVALAVNESCDVRLFHETQRRGLLRPPRLLLESSYPLGLIRAWSWLDLDLSALVYPAPVLCPLTAAHAIGGSDDGRYPQPGSDDFWGFRPYRAGDNPRHVLWRAAAKEQPLQSLQFAETPMSADWLTWESVQGDTEQRLGKLCYRVLDCVRRQQPFGLALPGHTLRSAVGDAQRDRALQLLACFGQPGNAP